MGELSNAMQNLVGDIKSSAEGRRISAENRHVKVSEMKSDTRNLMERFRLEHQDMTDALKEKFSLDSASRKKSAQQLLKDINIFMDAVRSELQNMLTHWKRRFHQMKQPARMLRNNSWMILGRSFRIWLRLWERSWLLTV